MKQAEERYKDHIQAASAVRGPNRFFLRRHSICFVPSQQEQASWLPQPLWLSSALQQSKSKSSQGSASQESDQQGRSGGSQQGKRSASTACGGSGGMNKRSRNQGYGGNSKNYNRGQPFRRQEFQGDNRSGRNTTSGPWNSSMDSGQGQHNKGGKSKHRGGASQNFHQDGGGKRGGGKHRN